jgi:hypothetical protein
MADSNGAKSATVIGGSTERSLRMTSATRIVGVLCVDEPSDEFSAGALLQPLASVHATCASTVDQHLALAQH